MFCSFASAAIFCQLHAYPWSEDLGHNLSLESCQSIGRVFQFKLLCEGFAQASPCQLQVQLSHLC